MKNFIKVRDVSVKYDTGKWGIKNFNLNFNSGDFISLIGANGSGKTTFINSLCGFLKLTEGNIEYNESIVDVDSPFSNIGWTSQTNTIDWYLNVEDNVRLGIDLLNFEENKKEKMVEDALKVVDLYSLKHASLDELSGGQQQRVQIARALVHQPDILILDEPTTGLDPRIAQSVIKHLSELARNGSLVIVSSHDLSLVEENCNHVLLIKNGEVILFEEKNNFLNQFSDKKIINIELEEDSDDFIFKNLPQDYKLLSMNPISLEVSKNITLKDILQLTNNKVDIKDFSQSQPTLREIYLNFEKEGN